MSEETTGTDEKSVEAAQHKEEVAERQSEIDDRLEKLDTNAPTIPAD